MRKLSSVLAAGAVVAAGCLGLAACGSSNDNGGGGGGGKKGGSIRIGSVLPDSYDPVLFQSNQANQALQLNYTGLVTYKHEPLEAGRQIIPGLAEALPEVSADKKTYTFTLRKGLKYSDGSPVKASDYEHTVKRLLYLGGPFSSFSAGIVGAAEYQAAKKANGDISGITSDEKTGKITIKLKAPDSKFLYAIGLASSAPTPAAKSPFKASRPPGIGPYTVKVVNPTREIVLTQTPGFNIPGIAKGNFKTITVVKESVPKMTQDVINNKLDFMTEDPAGDLLPQVRAKYQGKRFREDANPPNTYWFFLNESVKPFDKKQAREAVNYAIDSRALQRIFGGRLEPGCNFLPPAYAGTGYKKIDPCPWGDPNGPGNVAKAKQLVDTSGYKGTSVTVWANNKDPRPAIADYLRSVLNEIGFKAKTRILDQQVYFGTIGDRKTKAQAGFTDWYQDFPHPADFFEPNLSKVALASNPTFNFEFKSNPKVDQALKQLTPQDPASVADKWAAVDRAVIEDADAAVYGHELATSFFSERMNFNDCHGVHPLYKNDWAEFCLK
jgi:peptide/nickel transport system substrate-binding protein